MIKEATKILRVIEEHGFKAYLVGGCVRDTIMQLDIKDCDICTSATPIELMEIFEKYKIKPSKYGSVILFYKGTKYEITTLREESTYSDGRRPDELKYIDDLEKDLPRRDFTINTICMDKDKNIIDFCNGIDDIQKKIIKTVGNPEIKFYDDALRILRAIRFATVLNFEIEESTMNAIKNNASRIELVSYERRKEELDKIFLSDNKERGVKLLVETGLDKWLGLEKLKDITLIDDINGIWAQLNNFNYPFKKSEKKIMKSLIKILESGEEVINNFALYNYGLYICMIIVKIRKQSVNELLRTYNLMPLLSLDSLNITSEEIIECLNLEENSALKDIYDNLVYEILSNDLKNDNKSIIEYLKQKYNI